MTYTAFSNTIRFNPVSGGTAAFVVASAASGCSTPEQASAIDGKTYHYYAQSADGSVWEDGFGPYTFASHTQARTTIRQNSNGDTNPVNFASPPIVDVFPSPSSTLEQGQFPSGTPMLFVQSTAPVGWTKQTTHNDKALRVVSGSASSGGSNSFSTVMAQTTVGNTTISIGTMPSHDHPYVAPNATQFGTYTSCCGAFNNALNRVSQNTGAQGGGAAHNHTILMNIQYVDVIIAVKN